MNLPIDSKQALQGVHQIENISLDYERSKQDGQKKDWPPYHTSELVKKMSFHRYVKWKKTWRDKMRIFKITAKSNILIDTNGGAADHGIALLRWCGAPWLPASGLKGCTRKEELNPESMFGTTEKKGDLIFLPGFPLNASTTQSGITPHGNRGPNPLTFPAIAKGSEFIIGIINTRTNDFPDIKTTLELLGIGAKTTSGFGWVELSDFDSDITNLVDKKRQLEEEKLRKEKEIQEKQEQLSLMPQLLQKHNGDFKQAINSISQCEDDAVRDFLNYLWSLPDWKSKIGDNPKNNKWKSRYNICIEASNKLKIQTPCQNQ